MEVTDIDVSGIMGNDSGLMQLVQEVDRESPNPEDIHDDEFQDMPGIGNMRDNSFGDYYQHNEVSYISDPRDLGELEQDSKMKDEMLEKDFFKMSVLAMKMIYTEDYDADYLGDIDAEELYEQAKEKELPFHRWQKWLEDKFWDHNIQNDGNNSYDAYRN